MPTKLCGSARLHRPARLRPPSDPRAAFRANAASFVLVGTLLGSWAAVVPAVSDRVGVDHVELGMALLGMALGALAGMQLAGAWCARWGAGRTSAVAVGLASLAVVLPAAATSLPTLCVALLVFGAATGAANVAVNTLGVELQHSLGRPVMSLLHAGFSFGGLLGAVAGGLTAEVLPTGAHLLVVGGLGVAATWALRPALAGFAGDRGEEPSVTAADPESGDRSVRPLVVMLGIAAGCTAVVEGAVTDWGSLHLRQSLGATASTAALGYAAFSLAMGGMRLAGRRVVIRYGDTPVQVCGAVVGAAGMLLTALASTPAAGLVGLLLAGAGLANVFPLAIGRAGLLDGSRGVSLASTVGYAGLLGGPPVIGLLSHAWGLRGALVAVAGLGLAVAGLAAAVERRLGGRSSVAAALRRQARTQLRATAQRGGRMVRSHGDSLRLLLDPPEPAYGPGPRPISDTFPY